MTRLWLEAWTRPGDPAFDRLDSDVPVRRCSFTSRLGGVGEANAIIPDTYTRFAEILNADRDTPANAASSLLRVFAEGHTGPIYEWIPNSRVPEQESSDPDQEVVGLDIGTLLSFARVEPWDWDGTDSQQSRFPDWIWGGRNLLGDLSSRMIPEVVELTITATAGTITLTVTNDAGSDTTDPIAFNAGPVTIDNELTALTNVTFVEVDGQAGGPFRLTFSDPSSSVIVGGSAGTSLQVIQQGGFKPAGWEESRSYLSDLPHGFNVEVRMWVTGDPALPAGCDTAIMFNGTEPEFPGVQRVQNVKPGGVYQASVQITGLAADEVRFVIRDLAENILHTVSGAEAQDQQTIAIPGTFQTFSIANLQIPDNVDQIIVRVGHVGTGDPGRIFVACPELTEGLAPDTVGAILGDLYDDAVTNHSGDGRVVWDDGGGSPYLTLDFTDTLDSGGNAWTDSEVSLVVKRGQSYLGVMAEIAKLGYEWRIIADDWEAGTWLWQVFNPDGLGTDYSAAATPTIEGGRDTKRRDVRMFLPPFTDIAVEGLDQRFGRARNATLITALGRIEGYKPERDLATLTETGTAASVYASNALAETLSLTYTLTPGAADPHPFDDYVTGDILRVQDPPEVDQDRRVATLQGIFGDQPTEYIVQLGTSSYVGELAIAEAVRILTSEFKAIRDTPPESTAELAAGLWAGAGKSRPIIVAASNAPDDWKAVADFICTGSNANPVDGDTIQQAIDTADDTGAVAQAYILFSPGHFWIDTDSGSGLTASKSGGVILAGSGPNVTSLRGRTPTDAGPDRMIISCGQYVTIRDMSIVDWDFPSNVTVYGVHANDYTHIENVYGFGNGWMVFMSGSDWAKVRGNFSEWDGGLIHVAGTTIGCQIAGNSIVASTGVGLIWVESTMSSFQIVGNYFINTGSGACILVDNETTNSLNTIVGNYLETTVSGGAAVRYTGDGTSGGFFSDTVISDNVVAAQAGMIFEQGGQLLNTVIRGNSFANVNGSNAVHVECPALQLQITGNTIANAAASIVVDGTAATIEMVTIADNTINDPNPNGVLVDTVTDATITGNHVYDSVGDGIVVRDCVRPIISGNRVFDSTESGMVVDGCSLITAVGNQLAQSTHHGLELASVQAGVVASNVVDSPGGGGTNTYDAIILTGDTDDVTIHHNTIRPRQSGATTRYGINVSAASCGCNIILGNNLWRSVQYGTAALNDAGTNTRLTYPNDVTVGDNLLDCGGS